MNATRRLHDFGQSLWLDSITREMLESGTLRRYIDEYAITGLTSNPTIFDHAIRSSDRYDDQIRAGAGEGLSPEEVFFDLAFDDLTHAADLLAPVHERTNGLDGWVSLEVSPRLAHDTPGTISAVKRLHARSPRRNLFLKIPGTREGLPAIEEASFAGIAVNVTLLFSPAQYQAAAEAYLRGLERRLAVGLNPAVGSVASVFISRWDKAVMERVPEALRDRLGITIGQLTYRAYRDLLETPRWLRLLNAGARPQRLLWGSTSTKDPRASDVLYVEGLAAPFTVNTMPEETLHAFADHGTVGEPLPRDGGTADQVVSQFAKAGVDTDALASQLQEEGARAFVASWDDLLERIAAKSRQLVETGRSSDR